MTSNSSSSTVDTENDRARPRGAPLWLRPLIGAVGLGAVVFAELIYPGSAQEYFSGLGLVALVIAAILAVMQEKRRAPRENSNDSTFEVRASKVVWRVTFSALGVFGTLVAQTWFRSGTVIANGDITPPVGTAWFQRIFNLYGWTRSDLGGPALNQVRLPFGLFDALIHLAGGSGALAQRAWLTLLIAGIMMAAAGLARSLAMSPIAATVVGIFFFFNPMTISQVNTNDVFLLAMVLVAALPAVLISRARGNIRQWQLNVAFVIAAPLVGFMFQNPPLLGMLAVTLVTTPVLVWVRFGRDDAARSIWGLLIAGAFAALASGYWFVPNLLATSVISSSTLSSVSAWAFTESRSTIANGFWLNTTWAWKFSEYFPYAHFFRQFPVSLVRPLIPVLAFARLVIRPSGSDLADTTKTDRLAGLVSLFVLMVIFVSNGTNLPGSLLFDPLYHLPYGWLLREPGRFLLVAALGYALLTGLLVDRLHLSVSTFHNLKTGVGRLGKRMLMGPWLALGIVVLVLSCSFPLWTGVVVQGPRSGFPSAHVTVPKYWESTAAYLNSPGAPEGSLLVLPPDDFYQMPYTWYYGNDGFISNLLSRHVVDPSGQGYDKVSSELIKSVQVEASSLLHHSWLEAGRVLNAIGTPLVIVRGDINSSFEGRSIVSPRALSKALEADPNMHLVRRTGPLSLYMLNSTYRATPTKFATTLSPSPDLWSLSVLPGNTALITSPPRVGHPMVVPVPSFRSYSADQVNLVGRVELPSASAWKFHLAFPGGQMGGASLRATFSPTANGQQVAVISGSSISMGSSLISNGLFQHGGWGAVGNCDATIQGVPENELGGGVIYGRRLGISGILALHASVDSACENTLLNWHSGSFSLKFLSRSLAGSPPRICLWEEPINRCALIHLTSSSSTFSSSGWKVSTSVITPNAGTNTISLFVYADAPGNGKQTITQYADFSVRSIPSLAHVFLVGLPRLPPSPESFVIGADGYLASMPGSVGSIHVIVDGLRNGWLMPPGAIRPPSVSERISVDVFRKTLAFSFLMLLVAGGLTWMDRRRRGG